MNGVAQRHAITAREIFPIRRARSHERRARGTWRTLLSPRCIDRTTHSGCTSLKCSFAPTISPMPMGERARDSEADLVASLRDHTGGSWTPKLPNPRFGARMTGYKRPPFVRRSERLAAIAEKFSVSAGVLGKAHPATTQVRKACNKSTRHARARRAGARGFLATTTCPCASAPLRR